MIDTSTTYSNAVISNSADDLQKIHLKTKNIAIYQRNISALEPELLLIQNQEVAIKISGDFSHIKQLLQTYFEKNLTDYSLLFEDISMLLKLFADLTQVPSFRLTLNTVSTDMCRKFHTDLNDLRMLCTYIGQGTLWLPDEAINLKALQNNHSSNQDIVADEGLIQQANQGDVVMLKGALYPDANPILHRSPPIESNHEKRLLLRIDTNASVY
ncbi:MAG: DUF1826 domain-containing protein [Bernardetiaceae bacterium]|nr:DUF1826 domain-containing protein [Bernardetiaceae bacterium]